MKKNVRSEEEIIIFIAKIKIMKKIFTLFTVLLLNFQMFATHLMGGEIVVQHDQGDDYEILLTLYRDTLGIPASTTTIFDIYDANMNNILTVTSFLDPLSIHPIFGLQNGSVLPMFPYGVEVYHYSAIISLPIPGTYTVSWSQCCRNSSIQNIPNAASSDIQLYTDVTVSQNYSNSTPYFMVKPVVFLPVNTPWQYNPLPFDPDGDSLIWSIGVPHESGINVPKGYPIAGYTDPPSVSGGALSIDPYSGTISWTASMMGNFVYTVICEEYRNGVKIGEIRRDMQFIVLSPGPVPSLLNLNTLSTSSTGVPYVVTTAGDPFDLNLFAIDSSVTSIGFEAYGEPFILSNPMTYIQGTTDEPFKTKVSLMWTPTSNEARVEPYIVVLRLMNGTFSMDYTIFVYVNNSSTGVNEIHNEISQVYPNPSVDLFYKEINLITSQRVSFQVYDMKGVLIYTLLKNLPEGNNLMLFNEYLNSGNYILHTVYEDGKSETNQIYINH